MTLFNFLHKSRVSNIHFFLIAFQRFSWKEIYNFFPVKFYFYWTILATRVYERNTYIMRMKDHKQLNICCVLTWFILFCFNERVHYYYDLLKLIYCLEYPSSFINVIAEVAKWPRLPKKHFQLLETND